MGLAPLGVEVFAKDLLEFFLLLEGVLLHLFKLGLVLFSELPLLVVFAFEFGFGSIWAFEVFTAICHIIKEEFIQLLYLSV